MGGGRSRLIHLDMGQIRNQAANYGTVAIQLDPRPADVPFEALFLAHYGAIRELGRHATGPGLGIVAVHLPSCKLAGRAWVAAPVGSVKTAIIGRHSECDLLLEDPALSLRHLAVVTRLKDGWDASNVAFGVFDLRTGTAFRDERGRPLEGLLAQGPVFLAVGSYALFLLQTGEHSSWPELATDAWAMLPDRVYIAEREAEPDRWRRGRHAPQAPSRRPQTLVSELQGPLRAGEPLVLDGETPIGILRVASGDRTREVPVGAAALARGVLFGRYPRCDAADLLRDPHISRAHFLVIRVDSVVYGIDTASTEGTSTAARPRERARVVELGRGDAAILGEHRAYVSFSAID